jgi:hypothetical protein
VESPRDVQLHLATAHPLRERLQSPLITRDNGLPRRVEVGRHDGALNFVGGAHDLGRVGPDKGYHASRVLTGRLVHEPVSLRYEPHGVLEPQSPRRVRGGVLA